MRQLRKLWQITRKDLLVMGKDRGSWIVLLLTPLLIIMVASFALGPAFSGELKSKLLYANLDQGAIGKQLVDGLKEVEGLELFEGTEAECQALAAGEDKYKTCMLIPAGFS